MSEPGSDRLTPRGPAGPAASSRACDACIVRSWLLDRLAAHLERVRGRIAEVLALGNEELIRALGGACAEALLRELERCDPSLERARAARSGVAAICACDPGYPAGLRDLSPAPAILHVAGGLDRPLALLAGDPVAIVGARRASQYGLDVAETLGRDLARAGIPIISGMALGIDSAAHRGALLAGGATVAVLPAGAQRAYPAAKRALHAEIRAAGAAVSELPGAAKPWRWMFPARNRLIAALSVLVVVVEADERSGSLVTAAVGRDLARVVGAVPGRVTSPTSRGTNALLAEGIPPIRHAQDVLDLLYGAGARRLPARLRPQLDPELEALLDAISAGHDTPAALERAGFPAHQGLAALASLELAGYVRREPGGRFAVTS